MTGRPCCHIERAAVAYRPASPKTKHLGLGKSMSKKIISLGTIISPRVAPQAGYWESLSFFDDNGFLHDTGSYITAMGRAGLRCINSRSETQLAYSATNHPEGLFSGGITPLGRDLLEILANEGFEGEVRDLENGGAHVLSGGSVRFALDSQYDGGDMDEYPLARVA